ncbi:hypothetical protein ACMZOO_15655 [Catenovulum sp. SX2]|uniref:hypothetical protein n=1 Tax=Catenovulum sp. SX2 TaxID=3398614 RepID=UPI003F83ECD5
MNKTDYLNAILVLSLVVISTCAIMYYIPYQIVESWLTLAFIVAVPFQVVFSRWINNQTKIVSKLALVGLYALLSAMASIVIYYVFSASALPKPQLINYAIIMVVVTFWFVIVWNGWPIANMSTNPYVFAVGVVFVAFAAAAGIYALAFDFSHLQGSGLYIQAMDPSGWFNAWYVIAFMVTTVAIIFSLVLLDFWPATSLFPKASVAASALVNSCIILILASLLFYTFVLVLRIDPVIYLVNGPISYIFGTFVPLNLCAGKLLSSAKQPYKGLYLIGISAICGYLLNLMYFYFAYNMLPIERAEMLYQHELWVANAMLAFSFPLLVIITDQLKFWPVTNLLPSNKRLLQKEAVSAR